MDVKIKPIGEEWNFEWLVEVNGKKGNVSLVDVHTLECHECQSNVCVHTGVIELRATS